MMAFLQSGDMWRLRLRTLTDHLTGRRISGGGGGGMRAAATNVGNGLLHYTMFVELHGVPHTLSNAVFCQAQHVERAITQYLQKLDTFDTDIEKRNFGRAQSTYGVRTAAAAVVATAGRQQQQEESEHNVEVDLEPYSSSSHNYSDYLATVYSPIPAEDLEPSSFQASTLLQEEHVAPAAATLTKLMTTRRVDDGTMSDDVSMKSGSAKTRGEEVGSMTSSTKKRRRRGSHVSFSASALLIPPASSSSLSQAIVPVPVSAGESGALPTTNRQEQEQNIMRTLSESFTEMKGWVMEYRKTLFHLKVGHVANVRDELCGTLTLEARTRVDWLYAVGGLRGRTYSTESSGSASQQSVLNASHEAPQAVTSMITTTDKDKEEDFGGDVKRTKIMEAIMRENEAIVASVLWVSTHGLSTATYGMTSNEDTSDPKSATSWLQASEDTLLGACKALYVLHISSSIPLGMCKCCCSSRACCLVADEVSSSSSKVNERTAVSWKDPESWKLVARMSEFGTREVEEVLRAQTVLEFYQAVDKLPNMMDAAIKTIDITLAGEEGTVTKKLAWARAYRAKREVREVAEVMLGFRSTAIVSQPPQPALYYYGYPMISGEEEAAAAAAPYPAVPLADERWLRGGVSGGAMVEAFHTFHPSVLTSGRRRGRPKDVRRIGYTRSGELMSRKSKKLLRGGSNVIKRVHWA